MHQILCTRLLIWTLCLYFTQGCLQTEYEGIEYMDITWTDCSGAPSTRLFKGVGLHEDREYFEGQNNEINALVYLYYQDTGRLWGFNEILGFPFSVDDLRTVSSSMTVPDFSDYWFCSCVGFVVSGGNMQYTRSNCYDCGLNKFTPPGSNICQCRAGQTPGLVDGVCENCPANTYQDSPSNAACTSCGDYEISPAGSTSYSDCACGLQKIRPPGSNICQCRAGQSPGVVDGVCENCPINTYKDSPSDAGCTLCPDHSTQPLAGSTSASDCLCNAGYTKTGGGLCTPCESGTFKQEISDASCTPCPENTFSVVGNIANACTACPENSISAAGSSVSTACQCKNGFSGENGGVCSMCGGGKFSVES